MVMVTENPVGNLTPYELRHLAAHLEESDRVTDLHRLLALETTGQRNAWYETREANKDVDGYLADVERAWRLATEEFVAAEDNRSGGSIGLQCRYALVCASLNSHAMRLPNAILLQLLELGTWTPEEVLTYTRQIASPMDRVGLFVEVLDHLPEPDRSRALDEAVILVRRIDHDFVRLPYMLSLIPFMPPSRQADMLDEALKLARSIGPITGRAMALQTIVKASGQGASEQLCAEALYATLDIPEVTERVLGLCELAPHLPEVMQVAAVATGLAQTLRLQFESDRIGLLARLVPLLPEYRLGELLDEMRKVTWEYSSVTDALIPLVSRLSDAQLPAVLAIARSIRFEHSRAKALVALVPHLPVELRRDIVRESLDLEAKIDDAKVRMRSVAELAVAIAHAGFVDEALQVARNIPDAELRLDILSSSMRDVPELARPEVLSEALGTLQSCTHLKASEKRWVLSRLAHYLPADWTRKAIDLILCSRNADEDYPLIHSHLFRLADLGFYEDAVGIARGIPLGWHKANALEALASHVSEALRDTLLLEALAAAASIEAQTDKSTMILRVLSDLSEASKFEVLPRVLAMWEIGDHDGRAMALARLYPYILGSYGRPAAEAVESIQSLELRGEAKFALGGCWPLPLYTKRPKFSRSPGQKTGPLDDALSIAWLISRLGVYAPSICWYALGAFLVMLTLRCSVSACWIATHVLFSLSVLGLTIWLFLSAPRLLSFLPRPVRVPLFHDVVAPMVNHLASRSRLHEYSRAPMWFLLWSAGYTDWSLSRILVGVLHKFWALAWLAPRLPESLISSALAGIWKLPDRGAWSSRKGLTSLAPYLSESLQEEALAALRAPEFERLALNLIPVLSQYLSERLLEEAIALLDKMDLSWAPHGPETTSVNDRREGNLWEARAAIACRLGQLGHVEEAIERMKRIVITDRRVPAWTGLAAILVELPRVELYARWCEISRFLADQKREDMLVDLCALASVIKSLGGVDAVTETFRAVQDVGRWWP